MNHNGNYFVVREYKFSISFFGRFFGKHGPFTL
jgi:hypothetical protein